MKVRQIKELNIRARLRDRKENVAQLNDEVFIFDVSPKPLLEHPFKLTTYGFCLCLQGETAGTIDLSPYRLQTGHLAINIPGQLISHTHTSSDFHGICMVMSPRFVEHLGLPYDFCMNRHFRENPIVKLQGGQFDALMTYCNMVRGLLEKKRQYQAETLKHLTCAYFYGLGSYLYQLSEDKKLSRSEQLMQRFISEVHEHYAHERKVSFYAGRLNITAGHLSAIVKEHSGKSASEWIDRFVIMEAKAMLKSTTLTVQQISDGLNFPSQSFFGKFFRRVTGLSPKAYRDGSGQTDKAT